MEHSEMTTKNPYWNTRFLKSMFNLFSSNILELFIRCISWIKYYFCFCKTVLITSGWVFSYKLAEKAVVSMFVTYFTQEYAGEYNIVIAALFVNGQEALSPLLRIFMIYLSQVFPDHLKRIIICIIVVYTSGLAMLGIAGLNVIPDSSLFLPIAIIGVTLVAVGRAGLIPIVRQFSAGQFEAHEVDRQNIMEERVNAREEIWWRSAWVAGSLFAIPLSFCTWPLRLFITGSVIGITFIFFTMLRSPLDHRKEAAASNSTNTIAEKPITCIRVVRAALLKRHMEYPSSPAHFFHLRTTNGNDELELWPQAKLLRWKDKAAIIEFESTLGHEEQERAGRLCSVTMVQETKYLLKLVPMWSAFLVFGFLLSPGNTFFAEQASSLESTDILLIYLVLLQSITRESVSSNLSPLCLLLKRFLKANKLKKNMMKIWGGAVTSILCSAVAWRVEFFLLGLMEGLAVDGLEQFTIDDDHLDKSMKKFLSVINTFVVTGIGNALNLLGVYSNMTLFQSQNLNYSRLDLYYKYLTIYGAPINCVYLLLISIFVYRLSDAAQVNKESMSKTTVPDAYTTKKVICSDIFLRDRY